MRYTIKFAIYKFNRIFKTKRRLKKRVDLNLEEKKKVRLKPEIFYFCNFFCYCCSSTSITSTYRLSLDLRDSNKRTHAKAKGD